MSLPERSFPAVCRRLLGLVLLLAASSVQALTTFRLALPGADVTWDTRLREDARLVPLVLAVSDGLLGFDPVTGWVKAGLATSWTVEEGGRSWSFTLRAARWSDGTPITAADFVAAWGRAGLPVAADAPTASVLKARFSDPVADVAVFAGAPYRLYADPAAPTRGPGPFVPGNFGASTFVFTKNPAFREASLVKIDRLEVWFSSSEGESAAWFRDGLVDWVPRPWGPGSWKDPGLKNPVVSPAWGLVFLRWNLGEPRAGDAAYRRTLSAALDRTVLARDWRGPAVVPSLGFVPGSTVVAKAAPKLVAPVPQPVVTLLHPQGESYRTLAEGIADQWKQKFGIRVEPKVASAALVRAQREAGTFEAVLTAWMGDFADPLTFLNLFRSGNDMRYANPAFDALLLQAVQMPPGKERTKLVTEAETLVAYDVPAAPLLAYASTHLINQRRWSGWTANAPDVHPWQGIAPKK